MDWKQRTTLAAAAAMFVLMTGACASTSPQSPSSSPPPSASSTPSTSAPPAPSAVPYDDPGEPAGSLARADFAVVDGIPTTSSTALAPMVSGQTFVIEGQCTGGQTMGFRLERAEGSDPDARMLVESSLACDEPAHQAFTYEMPYDGVVQLTIQPDDDVTLGWAVARVTG